MSSPTAEALNHRQTGNTILPILPNLTGNRFTLEIESIKFQKIFPISLCRIPNCDCCSMYMPRDKK